MRRLVLDFEDIVEAASEASDTDYAALSSQIQAYRELGFEVVLCSSAGMIEHDGNVGKIPGAVAPELFRIIDSLELVYDELVFGKPDAGQTGLIIDDKSVTPEEFLSKDFSQICKILDDV